MKRIFRTAVALALAIFLAAPLAAQEKASAESVKNGQDVVVSLLDGSKVAGVAGSWRRDEGFYVTPYGGPARLIRVADIVDVYDLATGAKLAFSPSSRQDVPSPRHSRISRGDKILIAIVVSLAAVTLIGASCSGNC